MSIVVITISPDGTIRVELSALTALAPAAPMPAPESTGNGLAPVEYFVEPERKPARRRRRPDRFPMTEDEMWQATVPVKLAPVLHELAKIHPDGFTRAEAVQATRDAGVERSESSLANYLGDLVGAGLLERSGGGVPGTPVTYRLPGKNDAHSE